MGSVAQLKESTRLISVWSEVRVFSSPLARMALDN